LIVSELKASPGGQRFAQAKDQILNLAVIIAMSYSDPFCGPFSVSYPR